jgi:hypothetical protein
MERSTPKKKTLRAIPALIVRMLKGTLISSTEMVLAITLVLIFALVFMGILVVSFPEGTGLVDFYDELAGHGGEGSRLEWRSGDDDSEFDAVLSRVRRRVRDRPANAVTWHNAHAGKRLGDHHTIQTLARSEASIAIGTTGELRLGERSLVVVKREDRDRGLRRQRSSVVLLGGRVQGRIDPGKGKDSRLDIVTSGGTSEIRAQGKDGAEFSVTTNADQSSTVNVYSGVARLSTADGKIKVGPNEAITYDPTGLLGKAVPIPEAPRVVSPRDGIVRTFGPVAPRIRFDWAEQDGADAYRFILARDRELSEIVCARELNDTEFVHGDLPSGRYYWSVRSVFGHAESRASTVRSLRLVEDLDPPELSVDLPEGTVAVAELVVRGMAEPGSELFIKNESIPLAADGGFEYALKLKRGLNMIVIEAVDAAGNSAYRSQYVTARF